MHKKPRSLKTPWLLCFYWWARLGSNQRPLECESSALPLSYAPIDHGGREGTRTLDLLNANQMLSQLSYTPGFSP